MRLLGRRHTVAAAYVTAGVRAIFTAAVRFVDAIQFDRLRFFVQNLLKMIQTRMYHPIASLKLITEQK